MAAIYHIEYSHPSGDFFKSPEMTLSDMEKEFDYAPITEEMFVEIMKKNFLKRKTVRESNIKIFKDDKVIYEQKKF